MTYEVYQTSRFKKSKQRLPKPDQEQIEKLIQKLPVNPHIGRILDARGIRECRIGGRRVYFIVYDNIIVVLMVAISSKKDQQPTIDYLKENLQHFQDVAKRSERK